MLMKIDKFIIKDWLKLCTDRPLVGFVIDCILPYNCVMASIRLRCYDLIEELEKQGISAELYKPNRKYKALIFTKCYSKKAVEIANDALLNKIPIIDDAYFEEFGNVDRIGDEKIIREIADRANVIITASKVQQSLFSKYYKNVIYIPEGISPLVLKKRKTCNQRKQISITYCGYADKAKDVLTIETVLNRICAKNNNCKIILICEKDPKLFGINYQYIKYNQKIIINQIMLSDIFIAPRSMDNIERSSHSLAKITLPMALGIPVVASPIPSYIDTPVVLCSNESEWEIALNELIQNDEKRKLIETKEREYTKENLVLSRIVKEYKKTIVESISSGDIE